MSILGANSRFPDYAVVTEQPGDQVIPEAMRMFHTRYGFARQLCEKKDVLELGCGAALGLSYIAEHARSAIGGDYSISLLSDALQRSCGKLRLVRLDAHALPFPNRSFDVILLFEAIYYLSDPDAVLEECKRVLRPGGAFLVCLPNRKWPGFNPSPFSKHYFSASELYQLFSQHHLQTQLYGSFKSHPSTIGEKARDLIRRVAVSGHMIPMSFKAKARLKKLFYGRLKTISELKDGQLQMEPLSPLVPGDDQSEYRVLYALGRL